MILPLIYYGNPLLRTRSLEVKTISEEIKQLVYDMIETMDANNGIGLAAIQIGKPLKILIIRPEIQMAEGDVAFGDPEVFINPRLTKPSLETEIMSEGCLSVPKIHADVQRPKSIFVEALNLENQMISEEFIGFKAREIMHENDHLNGVLFIDRITAQKRKELSPFLKEIQQKYN